MPMVLHVLEISEIWICQIFEFFCPPKMNSTRSKQLMDRYGDGKDNTVYLKVTDNFYPLVHVRRRVRCILMVSYFKQNYKVQGVEWREKSREERASRLDWIGLDWIGVSSEQSISDWIGSDLSEQT